MSHLLEYTALTLEISSTHKPCGSGHKMPYFLYLIHFPSLQSLPLAGNDS